MVLTLTINWAVEILLNGKPVEYEIENESTVGEIVDGLAQWLSEQGSVIVSARLDGRFFEASEDLEVRNLALSSHKKLELESQNARLLVVETISELSQYLDRVARLAPGLAEKEIPKEAVDQLVEGLLWAEDVFKRVEEILQITYRDIEFEGERLHKRLLRLGDIRDHITEAYSSGNTAALAGILRESIAPLCDSLVRSIPSIVEKGELEIPHREMVDELGELLPIVAALPARLEAIAIKISIGDSAKGMEEFAEATSSLERAFTLIDSIRVDFALTAEDLAIEGRSFKERNEALGGILTELIAAFERKDRVLIGDLIEYEIAPITDALAKLMEKIQNNLKASCH